MKMDKRQFYGLIFFLILFPGLVISVINPTESEADEELQNLIAAFEQRQANAESGNQSISPSEFRSNYDASTLKNSIIINSFEYDASGRISYPRYFGGTFIDGYGILNILYVEEFRDEALEGLSQLFDINDVIIKPVKYSYSELIETITHLEDSPVNSDSLSLDVMNNRVIVNLNLLDEDQTAILKDIVTDSDVLYLCN